ncbi:HpcH/HpaI aldolase family protein [Pseudomonas sp. NPDC089569]|uniref:HpcH/HpaI aldolase family protein n=1 Tax=Pseudomonas sp. NPDC089569 TaxID=3390722 RepID=UPI003D05213E
MTTNNENLKAKLNARRPVTGTFVSIPHAAAIEACANSEMDFICIDAEHASIGRETMENMIRAGERENTVLVRIPDAKSGWVGWALDAGAEGVVVPRIESAAEAEAVVRAAYYSPRGARGVGICRGSSYGESLLTDTQVAHQRTCVIVQIETLAGVNNAVEIANTPGIDAIFVGPFDLALSLQEASTDDRLELEEAIDIIKQACESSGRCMGIFCLNSEAAVKRQDFPMKIIGADLLFIQQGLSMIAK